MEHLSFNEKNNLPSLIGLATHGFVRLITRNDKVK